jgi:metal-responsive CopG/Arc/MetJ family transcriptional regulator
MNVLTVKISKDLEREVTEAAQRLRISKSELARRAMVQYVARRDVSRKLRSAAEFAGNLLGSIHGTPPDLASNPNYLSGYGQ